MKTMMFNIFHGGEACYSVWHFAYKKALIHFTTKKTCQHIEKKKPESHFIVDIILHKNEPDHLDLGVQKNSSHNFCSDD